MNDDKGRNYGVGVEEREKDSELAQPTLTPFFAIKSSRKCLCAYHATAPDPHTAVYSSNRAPPAWTCLQIWGNAEWDYTTSMLVALELS